MPAALKSIFETLEQLFGSCEMDYALLKDQTLNAAWLGDYSNQRVVNSFLFNYIKIQDKLGASLFRKLLFSLREIDNENLSMIDILNLLEKLEIIESVQKWDQLREIRNVIAHEYPSDIEERVENIALALRGYEQLKSLFANIKQYTRLKGVL
jgi:AAA+ ATPase superfamily predicted ATPase